MFPEFYHQAATETREFALWIPVLGVIIVFLGMNMRIEIKIEKEDKLEKKD